MIKCVKLVSEAKASIADAKVKVKIANEVIEKASKASNEIEMKKRHLDIEIERWKKIKIEEEVRLIEIKDDEPRYEINVIMIIKKTENMSEEITGRSMLVEELLRIMKSTVSKYESGIKTASDE